MFSLPESLQPSVRLRVWKKRSKPVKGLVEAKTLDLNWEVFDEGRREEHAQRQRGLDLQCFHNISPSSYLGDYKFGLYIVVHNTSNYLISFQDIFTIAIPT